MPRRFVLLQFFLILGFVHDAHFVPLLAPKSSNSSELQENESKLVEIKVPVKITSMDDLIAWARNAMRSMASRIDITLASIDDDGSVKKSDKINSSPAVTSKRSKNRESSSASRDTSRRPAASASLVSTYASLLGPENSFGTVGIGQNDIAKDILSRSQNNLIRDVLQRANVNAYLPVLFDDAEISKFREEALRKYYRERDATRRENIKDTRSENGKKYSQAVAQQTSQVIFEDDEQTTKSSETKDPRNEKITKPIISVPFEAIVTITRENLAEPKKISAIETRDPPDEFPPYFEKDYSSADEREKIVTERPKKGKVSPRPQFTAVGDLLRVLGFGKKVTDNRRKTGNKESANQASRPKKPSETFTSPPQFQFEDQQSQRQRRNETSQRQEFDDDDEEEEDMGSLGSINDLLPLLIPILEDIIDPETETDLGEILGAGIPLIQGLSEPGAAGGQDLIAMIGPILTNILGGKDGQGSDVAAILGPVISLIAPLIGPILGPLIGPLLAATSNPPQAEGSSLATLISAVLGPLTQPSDDTGMSPLSILLAGVLAALSKELKLGQPGGSDVGSLVGAVLSGVITGTSAGLSGPLSDSSKNQPQPYGPQPYGPSYGHPAAENPVEAGSVNTRTNAGFFQAGSQQNRPVPSPANIVEHRESHRPYTTLPQRIVNNPQPGPQQSPYVQRPHVTGPLPAGTTNMGTNGGSSYLPYGNNAVPANSANPIGLIGTAIKDVLGAGVQVVSSVINVVFGIIGSSSSDEPTPVYGPPQHAPYQG